MSGQGKRRREYFRISKALDAAPGAFLPVKTVYALVRRWYIPEYHRRGCAGRLLHRAIADARTQGRRGRVLTRKDHFVHYYESFGFGCDGVSDNSTHGGAVRNQMRLTF